MPKRRMNEKAVAPMTTMAVVVVIAMLIVVGLFAWYVYAGEEEKSATNNPGIDPDKIIGYIDIDVDLMGSRPLFSDFSATIENISATYTTATPDGASFLGFLADKLGLLDDDITMRLEVIVSSEKLDYSCSEEVGFEWQVDKGADTIPYHVDDVKPFAIKDKGTYYITVKLYKNTSELLDTMNSQFTVS